MYIIAYIYIWICVFYFFGLETRPHCERLCDGGRAYFKWARNVWVAAHLNSGHYSDVVMGAIVPQITSLPIVHLTVYSGAGQRKHQSSASLASVREIHRLPVNFLHKGPVTRKMLPFGDVIMGLTHMDSNRLASSSPATSSTRLQSLGPKSKFKWHNQCGGNDLSTSDSREAREGYVAWSQSYFSQ